MPAQRALAPGLPVTLIASVNGVAGLVYVLNWQNILASIYLPDGGRHRQRGFDYFRPG